MSELKLPVANLVTIASVLFSLCHQTTTPMPRDSACQKPFLPDLHLSYTISALLQICPSALLHFCSSISAGQTRNRGRCSAGRVSQWIVQDLPGSRLEISEGGFSSWRGPSRKRAGTNEEAIRPFLLSSPDSCGLGRTQFATQAAAGRCGGSRGTWGA